MIIGLRVAPELAPYVPYCFLACYVAFVLSRPTRLRWLWVSVSGGALGLVVMSLHLGPWVCGLGLASALWAVIAPLAGKKTIHPAIVVLIVYPIIGSAALLALHPKGGMVLDRYLLAADGSLGLQPGFLMAAFLLSHPAVKQICEVFYFGLPVALVSLLHTVSAKEVVYLTLLLAASAMAGFMIFPAVGSQAAFHDRFPLHPPATDAQFGSPVFQPAGLPRNFMPSMHAAWGIALLLGAWPLGPYWRAGISIYLLPMLLYAISSHYLFDLVVAVPWTFAVRSVLKKQWTVLAVNGVMVAAWLILIRFGLSFLYLSAAIPWILGAATVAAPAFLRGAGRIKGGGEPACYPQVGS